MALLLQAVVPAVMPGVQEAVKEKMMMMTMVDRKMHRNSARSTMTTFWTLIGRRTITWAWHSVDLLLATSDALRGSPGAQDAEESNY